MNRFEIRYNPEAIEDISASFEWGVLNWGTDAAHRWYNDLERTIESMLSFMPAGYPLAPENNAFDIEVRQIILGRYRILFAIAGDEVRILYVRGSYTGIEDF